LVVIDEFLTVSLYQPNEFISRKKILNTDGTLTDFE